MLRILSAVLTPAAALFFLGGCAQFHGGSGFIGAGEFRTPSDYARAPATEPGTFTAPYSPKGSFQLRWPVRQVRINRGFHPVSDPRHQGVDLGGLKGTPVYAAHEGVVVYTGHHFHGYGNMVLVEYDRHWATLYAHLSRIEAREGQIVSPGQEIGKMGRTGHATGVHLHFELMRDRQPIDPLPYLVRPTHVATR
jgi:murein DD-endopeptidase MepM/ murein hydrolase activator NlpD